MDVSADLDGSAELEEHGLLEEDVASLVAEGCGVVYGYVHGRTRLLVAGSKDWEGGDGGEVYPGPGKGGGGLRGFEVAVE